MAAIFAVAVLLVIAHIAANIAWRAELPFSGSAMLFFDKDGEINIPTWTATLLLAWNALIVGQIAGLVSRRGLMRALPIAALSTTFLFLSADEAAKLHERIAGSLVSENDPNRSGWILIWLPMAMVVGASLAVMLWNYSRSFVVGLTIGAIIYLSGAVGCEIIGQRIRGETERRVQAGEIEDTSRQYDLNHSRVGKNTVPYLVVSTLEESLELFGIVFWAGVVRRARRDALATHADGADAPADPIATLRV